MTCSRSKPAHAPTMTRAFLRLLPAMIAALLPALAAASPPEVPAKVESLIKLLFARPEFEAIELSPDGKNLALLREEKGRKLLGTLNLETQKAHGLSGNWKEDVGSFHWCGPNKVIFQLGYEKMYYEGLWVADAKLENVHPLRVMNRVLVIYQKGPSFVLLTDLAPPREGINPESFSDLYRFDPKDNSINLAEKNPGRVTDWLADNTGRVRFAVRLQSEGELELLERGGVSDPWRHVPTPPQPFPISIDQSGNFLLMQYRGPDGLAKVRTFDVRASQFVGGELSDPVYDVDPLPLNDPISGATVGLRYHTSRTKIYWLDPDYARVNSRLAASFPGCVTQPSGVMFNRDVLFTSFSDTTPLGCYLVDSKSGRAGLILSSRPDAAGRPWAPMREVTFNARDGYLVHGYLTLPLERTESQRVPMIALSHGGPRVRDEWGYDAEVQFYAALGYGVLQVNYRGSSGFGRAHELPDFIRVGHQSVDDVADGLGWTVGQGYADPKRLVSMGGSYGGYIALALATRYPDLVAAAVGFAGVYDWKKQIGVDSYVHSAFYNWLSNYYPDVKAHKAEYEEISPVNQAGEVRVPVLLLHGVDDQTVEEGQSELMKRALRRAGKSVELVTNVADIHGLPDQQSRFDFYQTVAAFLLEHVPPDKSP